MRVFINHPRVLFIRKTSPDTKKLISHISTGHLYFAQSPQKLLPRNCRAKTLSPGRNVSHYTVETSISLTHLREINYRLIIINYISYIRIYLI